MVASHLSLAAGADIVSLDRNDPVKTRAEVQALGRKHTWKQVDMLTATPQDFSRLIGKVAADLGKVDILVNNAGICPRDDLLDYSEEYWNDTIQVNLNAPWFLARRAPDRWCSRATARS
jgi:2-deoxy-D-gluconate 3-dehydrogenase